MSEAVVIISEELERKSDKAPHKAKDGNGEVWVRWDQDWKPLLGKRVKLVYEDKSREFNGRTFTDHVVSEAHEAPETPETPPLGTGEYVTGQKPAIEVRRMCALNAATNATGMTAELLRHQTSQEVTPELYRAAWDAMFTHCFHQNLRACRALEDDEIPF